MTQRLPGEDAKPLEGIDRERWETVKSQGAAISKAARDGSLDGETLAGGMAALTQVPLDMSKVLNAVHVPDNAGVHAAGLERMLRRIPDGWGRWVRCDAGWYGLLVELDERIAALLPEYEIHQMKEKFGTLRFYWGVPEVVPECCSGRSMSDPRPLPEPVSARLAPKGRTPAAQAVMDAWWERELAHQGSEEHVACVEKLRGGRDADWFNTAVAQVEELVRTAQHRSATICERCSATGSLRNRGFWVKTLCVACAQELDFTNTAAV
jgi:hypothetical protein